MPDNLRINIRAMTPDERGFAYTQPDLLEVSGCIGHLRVDMGNTGTQFFSSWDDHQADLKTADFKAEFDTVINALRNDGEYGGILASRTALASYCLRQPESAFENGREYGFRVDTDKYSYLLRLNPNRGEYAAYCYAYEKEKLDRYLYDKPIEQEMPVPEDAQDPAKKSNKERLKEITDSIERGIRDVFNSGKFENYLATMSRFHRYSLNNTILIYMQKPDATRVAGFNKWKEFKRSVKKGEKGIKIIAPTIYKKKVEEAKLDPDTKAPLLDKDGNAIMVEKEISIPRFRVATVFDLSQTEGEPLPVLAEPLNGNVKQYDAFVEALKRSSPVPVAFEKMPPDTDGAFHTKGQKISIREGMSEVQTVAALVHEITHAKLHNAVFPAKDDPTEYDNAEILGMPCLFTKGQIADADLPGGLFKYELRINQDKVIHSIEKKVTSASHRRGTVVLAKPIELSATGAHVMQEGEALYMREGTSTLKQFYDAHKKDTRTQEVEAESVAYSVCQYYGIETGENSFGYIAGWSSGKELSELKDSLTTITAAASSLITDIDKNFKEVCKERGIEPELDNSAAEPEAKVLLDSYPMPDPALPREANAVFGKENADLLPLGKDMAQAFYEENQEVFYMENGQIVMAFETDDISSQPEGTVFGLPSEAWEQHPKFHEKLAARDHNQEQREAAFDAYPGDCYAIYQVKHDKGIFDTLAFMNYKHITKNNLNPNRSQYDLKYTAASSDAVTPERLFEKFNIDRPPDFGGHSLSVSDIVAIKQAGQVSYYYCDDIGFKELPDFRKPENYLRNAEMSTEDDYGMIDGIINNGQKQPTLAELEERMSQGQNVPLKDLYNAIKERNDAKKASVVDKLKSQPPQEKRRKAPKKSAEREI